MSADLVPISPTRAVEGVARVARLDAPAPGSYWRLRKAIKGTHTDRTRTNAMTAGTVLMLAAVERADGVDHAYHFAPHPSLPQSEQVESVFHAEV